MAYTFFCPNCGKRFDRDQSLAGKKARCKDCQHTFVIPAIVGPRMASASKAQPRSASPRPAKLPPSPPVDDPYGVDDQSQSRPPASNPYAVSDDEFVLPRRVKPVDPSKRKSRRRDGDDFAWLAPVTIVGLALQFILLVLLCSFLYCELSTAAAATGAVLSFVSVCIFLLGSIVFSVAPFFESAGQGLLCLFVPFYSLYYVITRWDSMKRPFTQMVSAGVLPILMALLLPAISAARHAALRAQQAQFPQMGEVAPSNPPQHPGPFPAPPPVTVPAPMGGISLVLNLSGFDDSKVALETSRNVGRKISEIARELSPGMVQSRFTRRGSQMTFTITPIRDPQAFADRINFGTFTSVQGRTITVSVSPESAAVLASETSNPPAPEPGNAPVPRPFGPRRFPGRPPIGRP